MKLGSLYQKVLMFLVPIGKITRERSTHCKMGGYALVILPNMTVMVIIILLVEKKDIIISGGENVYPQEIEQCLVHFEEIRKLAVVGRKDDSVGRSDHRIYYSSRWVCI